jgi:hypothetical protein
MEELGFKSTSLVSGKGLRATETRYPASQEGSCNRVGREVGDGDSFRPAGVAINCSEAVGETCRIRKGSDKADMDVKEPGRW